MNVYLDASVLVGLFTEDPNSLAADRAVRESGSSCVVSDFAATEFASAVSRKVRTGELSVEEATDAFGDFDTWVSETAERAEMEPSDVRNAAIYLRRLDLTLRAPDAINIAIVRRLGCRLLTLDRRMASDAATLGVIV